jgi:hypothetical protein
MVMKYSFVVFLVLLSVLAIGQENSTLKLERIIIDSTLDNILFFNEKNPFVLSGGKSITIIKNEKTGKSDTIGPVPARNVIANCKVEDTAGHHCGFDNCIAFTYVRNDTLDVQFQNYNTDLPKFQWWDRLTIHIIKGRFYAEYIYTNKSKYRLRVVKQELILKRDTRKRGDRLRGQLTVQCVNDMINDRYPKMVTFKGPFDAVIQ